MAARRKYWRTRRQTSHRVFAVVPVSERWRHHTVIVVRLPVGNLRLPLFVWYVFRHATAADFQSILDPFALTFPKVSVKVSSITLRL